jgi:hypothetical protein
MGPISLDNPGVFRQVDDDARPVARHRIQDRVCAAVIVEWVIFALESAVGSGS